MGFFTRNIHLTIGRGMITIQSEMITILSNSALFFYFLELFEIKQIVYHLNHQLNSIFVKKYGMMILQG